MQTIAIPRGQVVLAGGTAKPDDDRILRRIASPAPNPLVGLLTGGKAG